jgi:AraC-like DNA-binding protein
MGSIRSIVVVYFQAFLPWMGSTNGVSLKRVEAEVNLHIMAVDCCEHTLAALKNVPASKLTPVASRDKSRSESTRNDVDLIVVGVARYPVRRLFISQLRRIYPDVPVMILRRIENGRGGDASRAEFILSEVPGNKSDLEIVRSLRKVLPIDRCEHLHKDQNYDTVRNVMRIIAENYSDRNLNLPQVSRELSMSPAVLSRILNKEVGTSFRQLLGRIRIEEAKRMLASRQYSVKEIAVRVGFSDSHYFSRSFKKYTGTSASEYQAPDPIFG